MKLVTIDFETAYSKDYSLSKMPTSSYILDPRYQTIGFAIQVNDDPVMWFTGTDEQITKALPQPSWWGDALVVGQNTRFDASILSLRYGVRPKMIADTMSMGRVLGLQYAAGGLGLAKMADWMRIMDPTLPPKGTEVVAALGKRREDFSAAELHAYGEYCRKDVMLTRRLFDTLLPLVPKSEMAWQDIVLRMATEPQFLLDKPLLEQDLDRVWRQKDKLLGRLSEVLDVPQDKIVPALMSNDKFAQVLEAAGVTPPTKISKTTGKETWAFAKTDEGLLELREHPEPLVQVMVEARLGSKSTIQETRLQSLITLADQGLLPLPYNISGAHTHRLSGADGINVQNMPSGRVKGQSKAMRQSIMAPEGMTVVAGDSSQIEARILAYVARQMDLLALFAAGGDPYMAMAARIYGIAAEDVVPAQRQVGKSAVLGAGFGLGAAKFKDYVRVTTGIILAPEECKRVIDVYRQSNFQIVAFWRRTEDVLRAMVSGAKGRFGGPNDDLFEYDGSRTLFGHPLPGIKLPNGTWINYHGLRVENVLKDGKVRPQLVYDTMKGKALVKTYIYGGKCVENLVQALAFALMKWQGIQIGKRYPVKLNTHDEHAIIVIDRHVEHAKKWLTDCMSQTPAWLPDFPVACEVSAAKRYGDC